jgi:hypothetical protein
MKKLISTIPLILLISLVHAQYSFQYVDTQQVRKSIGRVAVDNAGNSILTGTFAYSITLGSFTLTNNIPGNDIPFIAKMQPNGSFAYAKEINIVQIGNNPPSSVTVYGMTVDAAGNAYVTGNFTGKMTYGGSTFTSSKNGPDYTPDIFVLKISPTGSLVWGKVTGLNLDVPCSITRDAGKSVSVDNLGNVYVTAETVYKVLRNYICSSCSGVSVYPVLSHLSVLKFNSGGTKLWQRDFLSNEAAYLCGFNSKMTSSYTDGTNLYLTGDFYGSLTAGNVTLTSDSYATGNVFLLKLDADGNSLWGRSVSGNLNLSSGVGDNLYVNNNEVYVSGILFQGVFNFGSHTLTNATGTKPFLSKYSTSGTDEWAMAPHGNVRGVTRLPNGNLAALIGLSKCCNNFFTMIKEISPADGSEIDSTVAVLDSGTNVSCSSGLGRTTNGFIFSENIAGSYQFGSITISSNHLPGNPNQDMILIAYTAASPPVAHPIITRTEISPGIILYPNPASDQMNIRSNNNKLLGAVSIYDASGKMIYRNFVAGSQTVIDVKKFSTGVYYLKSEQLQAAVKFVKQ